jgi:hypothetical protein
MTEEHRAFRMTLPAAALLAFIALLVPAGLLRAANGGMLSTRSSGEAVRGALISGADSTGTASVASPGADTRHSPGKVALISAVLPGYGQIYNGSAWKLPVYYGLMGYFAWNAIDNADKYAEYRDQYLVNPDPAIAAKRDDYRKKRNTQVALLVATYALGIVDAYVDAHLYDFDRVMEENSGASAFPPASTTLFTVSTKF